MTDIRTTPWGTVAGEVEAPVVRVERLIGAEIADVWSACTEPERLARWLGFSEGTFAAPGDTARFWLMAETGPDDGSFPATFTLLELAEPHLIRFGFSDEADPDGVVTITLTAAGDKTQLTLEHALSARPGAIDQAAGFGAGWEGFLLRLDTLISDGVAADDDGLYEALLPAYGEQVQRLRAG
ncbi:MAG: SRPBCC domain-containing protein [Nocardioidaceae bacterium]